MDVLLCFCHFCELHGPNVILTTNRLTRIQLLSCKPSLQMKMTTDSCSSSMSSLATYSLSTDNANLFSNESVVTIDESNSIQNYDCDGCSLKSKSISSAFNGFLSYDNCSEFGFITNSYPIERIDSATDQKITNAMIRDACIRSLSCEVYENGVEGLVYFGDDQRGHVLSYLFVLQDSKARGFQRAYSILVIARNKHKLLSNWDFYVKHIQQIIINFKHKAKIIYESELTQTTCQQRRSLILDNVSNIGPNISSYEDILDRNPLNTHRMNSKARSLLELTGDKTTFANLHIQFSWILHAIYSIESCETSDDLPESSLSSINQNNQSLSLRHLYRLFGREKFLITAYNIIIGNKLIICDSNDSRLKCLLNCFSQILPNECILMETNCKTFDECSKHNFIGISSIEILANHTIDYEFSILIQLNEDNDIQLNDIKSLHSSQIVLHSNAKLPDKKPNYLNNIEVVLTDLSFSDSTFDSHIICLKNEWLSKSEALYSYTKGTNPSRTSSEMNSFMELIQIEDCDLKVLKFLANTGLSTEFKTEIFSINSQLIPSKV